MFPEKKYVNIPAFLLTVCIVSRTFPSLSFLYYLVPPLLVYFILLSIKEFRSSKTFRKLLILFLTAGAWFTLTSIWSIYPRLSLERGIYFFLLSAGCISAGFIFSKANNENPLMLLLSANIFIIIVSLISFSFSIPADAWSGGNGKGFMGFAGHQNTLGAAILFTLPAVVWEILKSKIKNQKSKDKGNKSPENLRLDDLGKVRLRNLYWNLYLGVNVFFLVLTYSRASMLALAAAFLVYLVLTLNWKWLAVSLTAFVLISLSIITFPAFKNFSQDMMLKDFQTALESRLVLWVPSYEAALDGGISGLGYGVSEPGLILPRTGSHYEGNVYVREKGNSILGLVEEAGVAGLVLFILPIVYVTFSGLKKLYLWYGDMDKNLETSKPGWEEMKLIILVISFVIAFCTHAQFEAWWVGVGSVFLPLFFVYLGVLLKHVQQI